MIYVCSLKVDNKILVEGKEVLVELSELYRVIWNKETREIEIMESFAEKYFTPSGLVAFLEEARKINPYMRIKTEKDYSVIFDPMVEDLQNIKSIEGLFEYLLSHKKDSLQLIHHLCESYMQNYTETLVANNKLNTLHLEVVEAKRQLENERNKSFRRDQMFQETRTKLDTLVSRINYNYNKDLDEDRMLGMNVEGSTYHRVLYVKEITRVHYTDTLLYYLQEILRTLYGVPARFVVIESAYAYDKSRLYPTCKKHTDLTYRDVLSSDTYMAGFHPSIMESILRNPSEARFLIVLDRSGFDYPYLSGENIEHVVTVSDHKDLLDGVQNMNRIISYKTTTLHIPYIKGFDQMSMEDKISRYSSMPIMKSLLDILERGD